MASSIDDVTAVERRDEGSPDGSQHVARDHVGIVFERDHFSGAFSDGFATLQHRLERLRRTNQDGRMRVVKIEKIALLAAIKRETTAPRPPSLFPDAVRLLVNS